MVDLSDKGSSCDDMMNSKGSGSCNKIKTCADCGTTKTPLWRGGPAGPKSLCNACGIRSRKRRRALLGLTKDDKKPKKATTVTTIVANFTSDGESQSSGLTNNKKSENMDDFSLERNLTPLGTQALLQRPRSTTTKQRRKLGEEEQAALLLMALSCGSVFR